MKHLLVFLVTFAIVQPFHPRMAQAAPEPPVLDWQITQQPAADFAAVVYANEMFVGVGRTTNSSPEGTIQTSADGLNWTERAWIGKGSNTSLQAIVFGGDQFVAVGTRGTIVTSSDGLAWEDRSQEAFTSTLVSVAYGNGTFVAVSGSLGGITIVTSTDGINWAPLAGSFPGHSSPRVAFGNGLFVILIGSQVLTSADGLTWTPTSIGLTISANQVIYGGGQFIAVGSNGAVHRSNDGIAWSRSTADTTQLLSSVAYTGQGYVATSSGGWLGFSSDGVVWQVAVDAPGVYFRGVAYGKGIYTAVGPNGISFALTPSNVWTRNWTSHPGRDGFNDIVYASGRYIAVGQNETIATSADGVEWTLINPHYSDTGIHYESILYANGLFIISGSRGTILTSTDGIQWTQQSYTPFWTSGSNTLDSVIRIAYGNGVFVALVQNSTSPERRMLTSVDGTTWSRVLQPIPANLRDLTFGNGVFAAVGDGGTVITSSDGEGWHTRVAGMIGNLRSVEFGSGKLLAVSSDGKQVIASDDGEVWQLAATTGLPQNHNSTNAVKSFAYGNGMFIIGFQESTSTNGLFYSSIDGLTWVQSDSGRYASFSAIAYGNSKFVAVGRYGVVAAAEAAPFVISLEPSASSIAVPLAGTEPLAVWANYSDGSRVDVTGQAVFESADSSIADVENGHVVGRGMGTTSIKVSFQGLEHTIAVEVTPVLSRLELDLAQYALPVGGTFQINANAVYSDDSSQLVTGDAIFASSDEAVAAVSRDGIVFGRSPGTAVISVTYGGLEAHAEVTIEALMSGIYLDSHKYNLQIGEKRQTVVSAVYSNGETADVTASSTFISLNPDIVSVDGTGEVTAVSAGRGTIRVDYGTNTAHAVVDVLEPHVPPDNTLTGIRLDSNRYRLNIGDTRNTLVYAVYSNGETLDVTASSTFVSLNPDIVSVDGAGEVMAVSAGRGTIRVDYGTSSVQAVVDVLEPYVPPDKTVTGIRLDSNRYQLKIGDTRNTLVNAVYSNGETADVTDQASFASSRPAVADVSGLGIVTANSQGSAAITVTFSGFTATVEVTVSSPAPPGGGGGRGGGGGGVAITPSGVMTLSANKAGIVSYDDKITVLVPDGAISEQVTMRIQSVSNAAGRILEEQALLSSVYDVTVDKDVSFLKPVTITLWFDAEKLGAREPSVFYYDEASRDWIELGGEIVGHSISIAVDRLGMFAVLAVDVEDEDTKPPVIEPMFADTIGHWAAADIQHARSEGFVSGYPDGSFRPDATVTRAEFTVMLASALKLGGAGEGFNFTDNGQIGSWAREAIARAVEAGIVNGYADGSFRPNGAITRAEMAVMIARALELAIETSITTDFADDADIPHWAKGATGRIQQLGILNGVGSNRFAPHKEATRAEAVAMLLRMLAIEES